MEEIRERERERERESQRVRERERERKRERERRRAERENERDRVGQQRKSERERPRWPATPAVCCWTLLQDSERLLRRFCLAALRDSLAGILTLFCASWLTLNLPPAPPLFFGILMHAVSF
jgi:hypothetical protein